MIERALFSSNSKNRNVREEATISSVSGTALLGFLTRLGAEGTATDLGPKSFYPEGPDLEH